MAYIGNAAQTAFTSFDKQTITGDGTAVYTLSHSVANDQEVEVFVNNVRQEGGSGKAYTVSGNQITFSENIASTDDCYVVFQGKAVQTVVPPAGSVTDSMITGLSSSKLSGALPALDGSALTGVSAGKVLQVVSVTETAASSLSNSGTFADVNGLTLNITPSSTSSKIMLTASVVASVQNTNADGLVLRFTGGNSNNYIGDTAGSRTSGAVGMKSESTNFHFYFVPFPFPMQYLDSPSTTSQITYKVQAAYTGGSGTLYFNQAGQDGDNNTHVRTASTITAMEIEA